MMNINMRSRVADRIPRYPIGALELLDGPPGQLLKDIHTSGRETDEERHARALKAASGISDRMKEPRKLESGTKEALGMDRRKPVVDRVNTALGKVGASFHKTQLNKIFKAWSSVESGALERASRRFC